MERGTPRARELVMTDKARLVRLAAERDRARALADNLGAQLRATIREVVKGGRARPEEIAEWIGVTPQFVIKALYADRVSQ